MIRTMLSSKSLGPVSTAPYLTIPYRETVLTRQFSYDVDVRGLSPVGVIFQYTS